MRPRRDGERDGASDIDAQFLQMEIHVLSDFRLATPPLPIIRMIAHAPRSYLMLDAYVWREKRRNREESPIPQSESLKLPADCEGHDHRTDAIIPFSNIMPRGSCAAARGAANGHDARLPHRYYCPFQPVGRGTCHPLHSRLSFAGFQRFCWSRGKKIQFYASI